MMIDCEDYKGDTYRNCEMETPGCKCAELDRLRAELERLEGVQASCHRDIIRLSDEIDHLRAEKAEANNQWRLDYNACAAERDRLRAENERLRERLACPCSPAPRPE